MFHQERQKEMTNIRQQIKRYPVSQMKKLIKNQMCLQQFLPYYDQANKADWRDYSTLAIIGLQINSIKQYPEFEQIKQAVATTFEQLREDIEQRIKRCEFQNKAEYDYVLANIHNLKNSFLSLIQASTLQETCSGIIGIFAKKNPIDRTTQSNIKVSLDKIKQYIKVNYELSTEDLEIMNKLFAEFLAKRRAKKTKRWAKKTQKQKSMIQAQKTETPAKNAVGGGWRQYAKEILGKMI